MRAKGFVDSDRDKRGHLISEQVGLGQNIEHGFYWMMSDTFSLLFMNYSTDC